VGQVLNRIEFELSSNLGGLGPDSLHGGHLSSDQVRKMLALVILHDRRADVEGVILKASLYVCLEWETRWKGREKVRIGFGRKCIGNE